MKEFLQGEFNAIQIIKLIIMATAGAIGCFAVWRMIELLEYIIQLLEYIILL